ncbi:hypothetical protein CHLNCDRAFT_58711 [Chlorella variabilis]|uniref:Uncharacterized protein n=1 Tax=Chlorella variabilis TaxID=554065 RepID=E1ZMJ1_CHLVA|nr:hypothetical protein CHLNCDRAFT_58711 [Chlorella variabilis]EFN53007.1 hypothetical protein CHLNCDRAFT_58711 [Chlorella variabilis]|eukprot:XP_005845109.1 hypothetical protein CHLNCDRAFT_58711 [Chlorella variabilis]
MGVFSVFTLRRNNSFSRDGSRRGRREGSLRGAGAEEPSLGKDSSTSSAVFDLELSQRAGKGPAELLARLAPPGHAADGGSAHTGGDPSAHLPSGLLQRIVYLSRPVMEFELDLLQDLRALRPTCCRTPDGQLDLSALVTQLQGLGYACYLKRNNPADPAHRHNVQASCLEKLRHESIVCAGRRDGSLAHWCVVDPRFREQFAIAQPTPAYDRCLRAVPLEFVGTPLRLQALVEVLCGQVAHAFASSQRTLPPWRKLKSQLSKWFDPEEMPGQAQQAQQAQQAAAAAAGAPAPLPSPFAQAPPLPAAPGAGAAGGPAAASRQSLLQLQAAAALAERQSSGGGSQSFYESLAIHQQSMRLQQQQAAAPQQQQPHRRPSLELLQQQQAAAQEQGVARETAAYLEAAWMAAAVADGAPGTRAADRSYRPRRRAGAVLGLGQLGGGAAGPWDGQAAAGGGGGAKPGLGFGGLAAPAIDLNASGSWSDLSTILETRSNSGASSPAAAALLLAANCQLGASGASRRSAGSGGSGGTVPAPTTLHQRGMGLAQRSSAAASAAGSCGAAGSEQAWPSPGASSCDGPSLRAGSGELGEAEKLGRVSGEGEGGTKKKAVSLLAKSLKSVSLKLTPGSLLPISTVRCLGPAGAVTTQRSWSWRSSGSEGSEGSRRGRQVQPLPYPLP